VPPLIGITCAHDLASDRLFISPTYVQGVVEAGGVPVLLASSVDMVEHYLSVVDGLLLSGGSDVDPFHFGEDPLPGSGEIAPDRDTFELLLVRRCLAEGVPMLGICRGMQVINIAAGGTIFQDIPTQVPGAMKHKQEAPRWYPTHPVQIALDSLLHSLFVEVPERVNSYHHQAVKTPGRGLRVCATAPDGIIEGIEGESGFVIGVQWHPDAMWARVPRHLSLFRGLVRAAGNGHSRQE